MYVPLIISWRLLTLPPVRAVPSAQAGLTSLFGKGRGGPHRYNHHKIFIQSFTEHYFLPSFLMVDIFTVRVSHNRGRLPPRTKAGLSESLRVISTAQL